MDSIPVKSSITTLFIVTLWLYDSKILTSYLLISINDKFYLYITTRKVKYKTHTQESSKKQFKESEAPEETNHCNSIALYKFLFCLFLAYAWLNNFNYTVKTEVFFPISAPCPVLCTFAVYYTHMGSLFHYSKFLLFSLYCLSMNGKKTSEVVSASSPHTHIVPQQPGFAVPGKTVKLPALAWSILSSNEILSKLTAKL